MLIGAEIVWDLVKADRIKLAPTLPILMGTELGWIAGGIISLDAPIIARTLCQVSEEGQLSELLKGFYRVEACDEIHYSSTADDETLQANAQAQRARKIFRTTCIQRAQA